MKITIDTNILVRIVVGDDPAQTRMALKVLDGADAVAVPLPCLCEFVWVLRRTYKLPHDKIGLAIRMITQRANVHVDSAAVAAGLRVLDAKGDFADGVIAAAGAVMGSDSFVSFDREAITQVRAIGITADLVSSLA